MVMLVGAYSPVLMIIGLRLLSHRAGIWVLVIGATLAGAWGLILWWLPHAQPRRVKLSNVDPVDAEVTAYIASLLLPIIAASSPSGGDIAAYVLCALLILVVAYAADLGSVNPLIYLFRLRVVRAEVDGRSAVLLVRSVPSRGGSARVVRAAGVIRVLEVNEED